MRDMFTHFAAYVTGKGNLQQGESGAQGFGWMPMWSSPEVITILNRAKGEDLPTTYEVSIHKALKAAAVLVAAGAESLRVTPSPLVEQLTGKAEDGRLSPPDYVNTSTRAAPLPTGTIPGVSPAVEGALWPLSHDDV